MLIFESLKNFREENASGKESCLHAKLVECLSILSVCLSYVLFML